MLETKIVTASKVKDATCCGRSEHDASVIDTISLPTVTCKITISSGCSVIHEVSCSEEVSYVDSVRVITYVSPNELSIVGTSILSILITSEPHRRARKKGKYCNSW